MNIQAGARSLLQVGVSVSDIGVLLQAGRSIGNWLRVTPNDEELFNTLDEDYGVILRRRGLVDLALMENRWSRQLHLIHHGSIVHDNTESRREEDGRLGSFSWLMVAIVTALEPCVTPGVMRDMLIDLFIKLLERDDTQDVRESLHMHIQTNIESWKSMGNVRGMKVPLCSTMKDCKCNLVGSSAIPHLTRAERQELYDFLGWLMAGTTDHILLVSATVYAIAAGIESAGIQLSLDTSDSVIQGQVIVQYANQYEGKQSLLDALKCEFEFNQIEHDGSVPPSRVSYLSGKPTQMIETFPCSLPMKNQLEKMWFRGAEAAAKVTLKAVARLRRTGVKYVVDAYDEGTSRWPGRLMALSSEHFPVDSESLLAALSDFMESLPKELQDWLYRAAKLDGGISDLDNTFSEQQLDVFLCFQSMVFGYWYKLLEPWVSMEYIKHEVYFYGVWGYRDTYLFVMIRTYATDLRHSLTKPHEGLNRDDMLTLLATLFAGRSKHKVERPRKDKPILSHGMIAILDTISVVSMSLLKISDEPQQQARFAVVSLPLISVLPDRYGELWTGDAAGIQFLPCDDASQEIARTSPQKKWSVHPKMTTIEGRLSGVVMMVRCGGVVVGVINPADADAVLLRAQENLTGHLGPREGGIGTLLSFKNVLEDHFQRGVIHRPTRRGEVVVVQSYGSPVMRYAAAGFYAHEAHLVVSHPMLQDAISAISSQWCGRSESCGYGVIIW